jgi:hypothetical protein
MTVEITGNDLLRLVDETVANVNNGGYADAFTFTDQVEEVEDINYALSV